ncbi:MAG TPA: hypothetical protein VGM82_11870 [Gemmatimonadaceae bacterium]|jgi:hypothetical protein
MGRFLRSTLSLALVFATQASCSSDDVTTPTTAAIVTFAFDGHPTDTMRVLVSRADAIVAAESYVDTHRGPKLLAGTIVRGSGVDPRYPFQFVPESVQIISAAIELCDATPMRTDAAVNDFFAASLGNRNAPAATWCPWSSYPILVQRLLPD